MVEVTVSQKLAAQTPRRRGARDRPFYEACAIDGRFSPRCTTGPFMRPQAKRTLASKSIADQKLTALQDTWAPGEIGVKIPFKKRVEQKAEICEYHRQSGQIKLPGNRGHEVLGPTTALQLEAECLEPILWKTESNLKFNLRTPDSVAVGTAFHDTASQYFKTGRLRILGRHGLHGIFAMMAMYPEDAGLTYPLRIDPEMKVEAFLGKKAILSRKAERCLRRALEDQVLRSKFQIFKDLGVVWAAADHRISVPLSKILGELFGKDEPIESKFDPQVLGELDLAISRWIPDEGILEITIDDYKTLPDAPNEEVLEHYRQSIQLPIYGALMDLMHLSDWEEMPPIRIRTRYQLIWETGTYTLEVPYSKEIALEALRRYYRYKPYLEKAHEFGKDRSLREVADRFFPAVSNDKVCPNCFAFGVCSLTRPANGPPSYLDQIMPAKKARPGELNLTLFR